MFDRPLSVFVHIVVFVVVGNVFHFDFLAGYDFRIMFIETESEIAVQRKIDSGQASLIREPLLRQIGAVDHIEILIA